MLRWRQLTSALVIIGIVTSFVVPADAFDENEGIETRVALSFPLGGPEKRVAKLQLLMNGPPMDDGFVTGTDEPPVLKFPLMTLNFDSFGPSNLALGRLTLWRSDRLYAVGGEADDEGPDWGTVAWIVLGVAAVGGLALAISQADDELFDAEKLCREQGGHLVNGQCVPN